MHRCPEQQPRAQGNPSQLIIGRLCAVAHLVLLFALSLPSTVNAQGTTDDVCGRTPQVRDELVRLADADDCASVTGEKLAAITILDLDDKGITSLQANDFAGLSSLSTLRLRDNELTLDSFPGGLFASMPLSIRNIDVSGNPGCPSHGNACFPPAPTIDVTVGTDTSGRTVARTDESVKLSSSQGDYRDALGRSLDKAWSRDTGPSVNLATANQDWSVSFTVPYVKVDEDAEFVLTLTPDIRNRWARSILSNFWQEASARVELTFSPSLPSSDTYLTELKIHDVTPRYDSSTQTYKLTVPNSVTTVNVSANPRERNAVVEISPADSQPAAGHQVDLQPGANSISITVTATDEVTTQTYTVTVTRDESDGVCGRTPQVRDELVLLADADDCASVTGEKLAAITILDLDDKGITSLQANDFAGLSSLSTLRLRDNELTLDSFPGGLFASMPLSIRNIDVSGNPGCPSHGNACFPPAPTIDVTVGTDTSGRTVARTDESVKLSSSQGDYRDPLGRSLDKAWSRDTGPSVNLATTNQDWSVSFIVPYVKVDEDAEFVLTLTPDIRNRWARSILSNFWQEASARVELTFSPPLSAVATLSALTLKDEGNNAIALTPPTFVSTTSQYSAVVSNAIDSVTLTATKSHTNATVVISGDDDTDTENVATLDVGVGINTLTVTVTAEDTTTTEIYTVTVMRAPEPTNHAPTFAADSTTREVAENSTAGINVGDPVSATDDDDDDTLTYSLEGTDAASFAIDSGSGQIQTKSGVTYDHEAQLGYSVTVKADDSNGGTDTIAVTINITDVAEPPSAPATPTVEAVAGTSDSLAVSWTAPDNTGKPDIESYDLQYRKGTTGDWTDGPQNVADTMTTLDGLDAGSSYQVHVRAANAEGDSAWSPAGSGSTDAVPPSRPLGLHVGVGDGEATAYWSAPASDGGAAVERYEYWVHGTGRDSPLRGRTCPPELANDERACALWLQSGEPDDWTAVPGGAAARELSIGNLKNGKLYEFQVRAVTAAGPGMYTWRYAEPYGEAGEPPELTVTLADRTVDDIATEVAVARWTEPANPAGLPLVGYLFEGSRDGVEWSNADGSYRSDKFVARFFGSCSKTYHSPCDPEFNTRRLVLEAHMTHWHFRVQALYAAGTLEVHADAPEDVKNKLRVRSPFSNVARAGEDGPLPEAEPLTVRFEGKPESHSGTPFSFRVVFNQAVEIDAAGFAAHALVVGNGTVTAAARVEARAGAWSVTIEPDSVAAVSVSLANPPCGEPGAVCTALGGRLEAAPAEMVPGPAPGVVTGFELVDTASGGETVTLTDGATVRLATPSAHRYGLMATVASADVKSVGLALRGPGPTDRVTKTENYAPWSLTGDTDGKAQGRALPVGSYTLVATAYAQKDLGGAVLGALSAAFTVAASDTAVVVDTDAPVLTGFDLVDTTLNGKLATLSDGSTVELADPSEKRYGIVAQVAPGGGVKSVTLSLSGAKSVSPRVESVEPWSLYGDDMQNPYGKDLPAGSYTLSATAHSEPRGAGAVLGTRSVRFTVQGPPALSVANATANESEGSIVFAVTLDRAAPGPVTVAYETRDGSAQAGHDYTAKSGTLSFAAGQTSKSVSVTLLDDAVDDGGETFELVLSNPTGGAVIADGVATGTIENSDPMPSAWLARFGRTVGSQVVDAVTARFEAPAGSHVTLGGERLSLEGGTGGASRSADGADEAAVPETLGALADRFGSAADGGARDREGGGLTGDGWMRTGAGVHDRTMSGRELLLGSSFHLAAGGEDGAASVAAWGRVATGGFDAEVDEVRLDGEVTTAMLGADVGQGRWLAGAAVAYSEGTGGYALTSQAQSAFDTGEVESRMTTLFPYARLALNERVSAWGLVGYGTGTLTLTEENDAGRKLYTTDIGMRMGAVGARGTVLTPGEAGGFELAVRTDALLVRTTSDATEGMASSESATSRLRLTLDGSRRFEMGGGTLTPRLELGLRHDGGDAETGTGVEVGAGLRYQGEGVSVEGAVRGLLAHEDEGYREWGASGSVRIDPGASGRGLSLTLSPAWGAASSGTERLWGLRDASGLAANDAFDPEHRLDAEVGYGFAVFDERAVATPYAGWSQAGERETLRLGQRLRLGQATEWRLEGELGEVERTFRAGYGYRLGSGLTFTTEASRREPANDDAPEHALVLRASMRW